MKILHALQTPDAAWRVEIIQQGRKVSYRLLHGQDVIAPLTIGTLELVLQDAGVDMAGHGRFGRLPPSLSSCGNPSNVTLNITDRQCVDGL